MLETFSPNLMRVSGFAALLKYSRFQDAGSSSQWWARSIRNACTAGFLRSENCPKPFSGLDSSKCSTRRRPGGPGAHVGTPHNGFRCDFANNWEAKVLLQLEFAILWRRDITTFYRTQNLAWVLGRVPRNVPRKTDTNDMAYLALAEKRNQSWKLRER